MLDQDDSLIEYLFQISSTGQRTIGCLNQYFELIPVAIKRLRFQLSCSFCPDTPTVCAVAGDDDEKINVTTAISITTSDTAKQNHTDEIRHSVCSLGSVVEYIKKFVDRLSKFWLWNRKERVGPLKMILIDAYLRWAAFVDGDNTSFFQQID
jgi:hypothetical protein